MVVRDRRKVAEFGSSEKAIAYAKMMGSDMVQVVGRNDDWQHLAWDKRPFEVWRSKRHRSTLLLKTRSLDQALAVARSAGPDVVAKDRNADNETVWKGSGESARSPSRQTRKAQEEGSTPRTAD
jgi:hypothetical protein